MQRNLVRVPYGYEPPEEARRGTLLIYDDFSDPRLVELEAILKLAETKDFKEAVFYPIHEETGKRMGLEDLAPYYRRVDLLEELLADCQASIPYKIDKWEGKRRKYTPVETALSFLTDKYKGPYFLHLTEEMAARVAGFASFKEWIRQIRLLVAPPYGHRLPPIMEEYASRWEYTR